MKETFKTFNKSADVVKYHCTSLLGSVDESERIPVIFFGGHWDNPKGPGPIERNYKYKIVSKCHIDGHPKN